LGVLVTVMPRLTAASTSMLSTPLPKFAISFRRRPARASIAASIRSVTVGHQHVGGPHRLHELRLAHRPIVDVELRLEELAHARLDALRAAGASRSPAVWLSTCVRYPRHRCRPVSRS
jgi:hypothetical protein